MNKLLIVFSIALFGSCLSLSAIEESEIADFPLDVSYPSSATAEQVKEVSQRTQRLAKRFEIDIRKDKRLMAERANTALDGIIKRSVSELRKRGHRTLARRIETEYRTTYEGFVVNYIDHVAIGDHPGIAWMISVHTRIESAIGETICKAIRLHDIYWLAYTIPVVFQCVDNVDLPEFGEHWNVFLGVCSYWVTDIACIAMTWGAGAIAGFCGFLAMGVEQIVKRFIAPKLAEPVWRWSCKNAVFQMPYIPYGPPQCQ